MNGRDAFLIYLLGALIALWRSQAGWLERIVLAVLWPLGPIAFVFTILILVAASPLAFLPRRAA